MAKISTFQNRFVNLLNNSGKTDAVIADELGVSRQALSSWRNGHRSPTRSMIEHIADSFHVDVSWLMGYDSESSIPSGFEPLEYNRIPLVGEIACGTPITAEENVEDYVAVPSGVRADFALRCKGDSMKPTCLDGDLVLIRRQPDVEDGQIAAVIIDGEATLKHVYHLPRRSGLQLVADNPAFPPILCGPDSSVSVQIVGRAVAYQRLLL